MEFVVIVSILVVLYFVPSLVACRRSPPHPQIPGVVLTNLFLGWTLVGWVVSFVWAVWNYSHGQAQVAVPGAAEVRRDDTSQDRRKLAESAESVVAWRPFEEARFFVRTLELKSSKEWEAYRRGDMPEKGTKPPDIPSNPYLIYEDKGWINLADWMGYEEEGFVQTRRAIQVQGTHHGESLFARLRKR